MPSPARSPTQLPRLAPVEPAQTGTPAPRHHENLARFTNSAQTSLFNVMELPATAVPTGLSGDGLPVGVQVVGGFGCDEVTIAVALALEAAGAARAA